MDSRPIGVFDSGVGGLTVARAIIDQLPDESVLYIGDSANTPYGPKPIARVRELALGIMDRLVQSDVKMLVIACNSASAAVLHDARERYQVGHGIPVVEVIQPAVRRAVAATRNGRIGVIGTEATIGSGAYDDAFAAAPHLELTTAACPAFVELVEKGITAGPQVQEVAERYLAPVRERGVDTLVLGCTHYPLLAGAISYTMGQSVTLVSSADETARDVYRRLAVGEAFAPPGCRPSRRFLTTGDPASFGELARRFLGPEVGSVHSAREISRSDLSCSDPGSHRQPDSVPSTQEMKR
ncbi:glutamate racemase [Peptidiphaga sp.]|jgi:glutamate racemase|uniref:glutamate racemase n=1 Tax=Peptidiphaga sp. TaxID=2848648 RepID=UPI00361A2D4C